MQPKKRVLIIHPTIAPYRVDFFNELSNQCELKVLFLRDHLLSQKFDKGTLFGGVVFNYDFLRGGIKLGTRAIKFGLLKQIRKFNPEVIIGHEYSIQTIQLVLWKKLKLIKSATKILTLTDDNAYMILNVQSRIRSISRTICLSNLDGLICLSQSVKEEIQTQLHFSKPILVSPLLQNEVLFRERLMQVLPQSQKLFNEYRMQEKLNVFYVGRLSPEKGLDVLLKSIALISKDKRQQMNFYFLGDGPQKKELERLIIDLGIENEINFLGRKEGNELLAWYNLVDILVLPSYFETFGAVVNEALMSGAKVICSDIVGAKELIVEDENGNIFKRGDANELSKLLECRSKTINNNKVALRDNQMKIEFQQSVNTLLSHFHE